MPCEAGIVHAPVEHMMQHVIHTGGAMRNRSEKKRSLADWEMWAEG